MPTPIPFDWQETSTILTFTFDVPGASARNCHVFLSEFYVKVNCTPKLADVDLKERVDYRHAKTRCRFSKGKLHLTLVKAEPGLWGTFKWEGSKEEVKARRAASIEEANKADEELMEARDTHRHNMLKKGESEQWRLDRENREQLDNWKSEEKRLAEEDVYASLEHIKEQPFSRSTGTQHTHGGGNKENHCRATMDHPSGFSPLSPVGAVGNKGDNDQHLNKKSQYYEDDIDDDYEITDDIEVRRDADLVDEMMEEREKEDDEEGEERVVSLRERSRNAEEIEILPPEKPLPAVRESERRILEFTRPARPGVPARDLPGRAPPMPRGVQPKMDLPEEQDPVWLKDKADSFVTQGDYEAAHNAYTAALKEYSNARAFANRAVCNLYLGNLEACIEDCNHALTIFGFREKAPAGQCPPPVDPEDAKVKAKLHVRKGVANLWLGDFKSALECLDTALAVEDGLDSETRKVVIEDKERILKAGRALDLKASADLSVRRQNHEPPIDAYDAAIDEDPDSGVLYANRAFVKVQRNDLEGALVDSTQALNLLQQWPIARLKAPLPPERPQRLDPPHMEDHTFRPQVRLPEKDKKDGKDDRDWLMKHSGGPNDKLPDIPPEYEWIRDAKEKDLDNAWIAIKKKLTQAQIDVIRLHINHLQNALFTRKPEVIKSAIETAKKQNEAQDGPSAKAITAAEEYCEKLERFYEEQTEKRREEANKYEEEVTERSGEKNLSKHCVEKTRRRLVCKVLLRQAKASELQGNIDAACEALREAIRLEPHNTPAADTLRRLCPPDTLKQNATNPSASSWAAPMEELPPVLKQNKPRDENKDKIEGDENSDDEEENENNDNGRDVDCEALLESARLYIKQEDFASAYQMISYALNKDMFRDPMEKVKCMINGCLCLQKMRGRVQDLVIYCTRTLEFIHSLGSKDTVRMECACYSRRGWAFSQLGQAEKAEQDAAQVQTLLQTIA